MKPTIIKAELQISDMNRHYYEQHSLTMAQHLDESNLHLMGRLIAFALFAEENLEFSKGFFELSEPAIWKKSYSNDLELWIDLGTPEEKRIKKACSLADRVVLFSFSDKSEKWWSQIETKLSRLQNLTVFTLPEAKVEELANLLERTMQVAVTIDGNQVWITIGEVMVELEPTFLKGRE